MNRARTLVAGAFSLAMTMTVAACTSVPPPLVGAGPSCTNGVRDTDEVGVDCGGVCAQKCTGDGCTSNDQCTSGTCEGVVCAAPVGKPCGVGTQTPMCLDDQKCELDRDCESSFCQEVKCAVPPPETHSDGQKNAGETGVDCGGSVKSTTPCTDGQGCFDSTDCVGTCNRAVCGPIGPTDGKKNNDETDVDCGGPNAPACPNGKGCAADADCADTYCAADTMMCVEPRNDDTVKNGTETDVDCGGASGKTCADGKSCLADGDCNGACAYSKKCVDTPSCKVHFGGDTCGPEEVGGADVQESCCRSLPVPGFTDPAHPGKAVYLDKFEVTAGRVRAFVESITAASGGVPNVKGWIAANTPSIWGGAPWSQFLPSAAQTETISVPRKPTSEAENAPWFRNVGMDFQYNQQLFVYVHGHNCGSVKGAYGFPTFWYPAGVMTANGGLARANPTDGVNVIDAQEALDVKAMTCITGAMLAAFCHWDGGQLATDEVLDFVTDSAPSLGVNAGCGRSPSNRCAPLASINASSDSGNPNVTNYYFPYYDNATAAAPASHEGVSRIAAPGRKMTAGPAAGQAIDAVRINPGDEPWMDLHGNLHEMALDVTGATFTGNFTLKYRGIGYSSSRAAQNLAAIPNPEYKSGYSGGRCMRFK